MVETDHIPSAASPDRLAWLSQTATILAIIAEASGVTELPGGFFVAMSHSMRPGDRPQLTPCWFDGEGNPQIEESLSPERLRPGVPKLIRNGRMLRIQDLADLETHLPAIRERLGIYSLD